MKIFCLILLVLSFNSFAWGEPYYPGKPHMKKIIGKNNLESIESALGTEEYDLARSVGRVELGDGYCTGFRIGENLVMTNHHCLSSCSRMKVRFHYEKGIDVSEQVVASCEIIEAKNKDLDFAILRVRGLDTPQTDSIPVLPLDTRPPVKNQVLIVAGHPAARHKEIDRSASCTILSPPKNNEVYITHGCDTESGNSGSPVLDPFHRSVVAIHWGCREYNHGTWMRPIMWYLRKNHALLATELKFLE